MDAENADKSASETFNKRKLKKLYDKIRQQMEFYFSDSNLVKDIFLQNLMAKDTDGYVDLEVFKTFNKIKVLTQDVNMMAVALSRSSVLQVSDDSKKVKRITAANFSKDFDACTLYVERLPLHADQKWIRDVFEHFGSVSYINIPRFKPSNRIKGFAFIEFQSPESVEKACEFYKNLRQKENCTTDEENRTVKVDKGKRKHNDQNLEKKAKKSKIRSVSESCDKFSKSHDQDNCEKDIKVVLEKEATSTDSNKRKWRNSENDLPSKRHKALGDEEHTKARIEQKLEQTNVKDVHPIPKEQDSFEETVSKGDKNVCEEQTSSKSKRKRKNKKNQTADHPTLRVMSKSEWKGFRNKYLELQRATMSHLKRNIMLQTQELREQEASAKAVDSTSYSTKKGLQFQPGVIVKINLTEPIKNSSIIKDQVKASSTVAYVDAPLDQSEIYVRCHTPEEALAIINEGKLHHLGSTKLLQDDDEVNYWNKIESDRQLKFNSPVPHKKRGREKIIARAMKLEEHKNKHIFFDD